MTGLTDDQRADFKLMKAFQTASATTPPERIKALQRFSQRVQSIDTIKAELLSWDLKFDPQPAKVVGRTLTPEEIRTGKGKLMTIISCGRVIRDFEGEAKTSCNF